MVACKGSYSVVPARETTWPLRSWSVPTIGSYRRTATESWDPPSTRKMPSRSRLPLRGRDWRGLGGRPPSPHGCAESPPAAALILGALAGGPPPVRRLWGVGHQPLHLVGVFGL